MSVALLNASDALYRGDRVGCDSGDGHNLITRSRTVVVLLSLFSYDNTGHKCLFDSSVQRLFEIFFASINI